MNFIDNKVGASAFGAAVATLFWTLMASFNGDVQAMTAEALASVTGATAVVVGGLLGYLVPNLHSTGEEVAEQLPAPEQPEYIPPE